MTCFGRRYLDLIHEMKTEVAKAQRGEDDAKHKLAETQDEMRRLSTDILVRL